MALSACFKRVLQEHRAICKEPPLQIAVRVSPLDILDWHFVIEGSDGTPYAGGYYYGKLKFPPDYPFKPPSIRILTPNGRFAPHVRIRLSTSDFHRELWNPMWSVSSILTGLLFFMLDNHQTSGSIRSSDDEKRKLAKASLSYNCENLNFRKFFPEYVERYFQQLNVEWPAAQYDEARRRQRKPVPFWLVLLLLSVLGIMLALPLLQI